MIAIQVSGTDEVVAELKDVVPKAAEAGAYVGIWEFAQEVLTEAKGRAPKDTGALRASGVVTPAVPEPPVAGQPFEVQVAFGGVAAPYAIVQHERTDFHHKVGEAKYLENALHARLGTNWQEKVARRAYEAVQKALK